MQNEYKLARQLRGQGHFARVTVEIAFGKPEIEVGDAILEPIDRGMAEGNRPGYSDWIDAAVVGARSAAESLALQKETGGVHIRIVRVSGHDCHTCAEDARCAAFLATWQAVRPDLPLPDFDFINGEWEIGN